MTLQPIHTVFDGRALAEEVLRRYDVGEIRESVLWGTSLNDTYLVDAREQFAVRVYRTGWRTEADIDFEMAALRHLAANDVPVAEPVADRSGAYWSTLKAPEGSRYIAVFRWAPGAPGVPEADHAAAYGRAMARLHTASASFGERGRAIDLDELITRPLTSIARVLDRRVDDLDFVEGLAARTHAELAARVDGLDFGFCHGDLHGGNANIDNGRVTMFDFDCSGHGWRAYDLAVYAWSQRALRTDESAASTWTECLRGYRELRAIPAADLAAIPWFVAARHLWYIALHAHLVPMIGKQWLSEQAIDRHMKTLRRLEQTLNEAENPFGALP